MRLPIVVFFLLLNAVVFAQKADTLRIVAYNTSDKVALKWLPGNYEMWMEGMKNGYHLDRYEVQLQSGKWTLINQVRLTRDPVRPWDTERLKREAPSDPDLKNIDLMFAGKDLSDKVNPKDINEHAELATQRDFVYILALFAQVNKNKTAAAMGTYFEDASAQAGKTYLYRVTINVPQGKSADVVVDRKTTTAISKISGFTIQKIHKGAELYWLNKKNSGYIYYNIYRSDSKNGNFIKLNEYPYVGDMGIVVDEKRFKYTDTVPELNKTYYYKVIGVNAFEKESPPTDVLSLQARYLLQKAPMILEGTSPDNKEIHLKWGVYDEERPYIKGFSVWHTESPVGNYSRLNRDLISSSVYTFADPRKDKSSSNYYTVCAYGFAGDSACSVLKDVFLIDSIPPLPPVGVQGICDTNGIVKLHWKRNTERDVLGYRIFRTYYSHKEPVRITVEYVSDTTITDTVEVKSGYRKVYYGVSAIDHHFNPSPLSAYFPVIIPDKNPPVNAMFKDYQAGYSGILLQWFTSPSDDIRAQYLLKKSEFDFDWHLFHKFTGDSLKITQVRDTLTKSDIWYEYVLVAEDSAGLKSSPSEPLRVQQPEKNPFPVVKNVKAFVSRDNKMVKLTWEFDMKAAGFKIMRGKNGAPVETYEYVSGSSREFYDKWLTPNTEYSYAIVAEVPGGRKSLLSKITVVKY